MMMCSAVTSLLRRRLVYFTRCGAEHLAHADFVFHFVFAEQVADAFLQFVGDGAASADDLGEIDFHFAEGDAAGRGFGADFADERAVFEQRLGGNASPVQTRAAEVFFFDAEDAFFELPGANRGRISRGSAADDDDVKVVTLGWSPGGTGAFGRRARR